MEVILYSNELNFFNPSTPNKLSHSATIYLNGCWGSQRSVLCLSDFLSLGFSPNILGVLLSSFSHLYRLFEALFQQNFRAPLIRNLKVVFILFSCDKVPMTDAYFSDNVGLGVSTELSMSFGVWSLDRMLQELKHYSDISHEKKDINFLWTTSSCSNDCTVKWRHFSQPKPKMSLQHNWMHLTNGSLSQSLMSPSNHDFTSSRED